MARNREMRYHLRIDVDHKHDLVCWLQSFCEMLAKWIVLTVLITLAYGSGVMHGSGGWVDYIVGMRIRNFAEIFLYIGIGVVALIMITAILVTVLRDVCEFKRLKKIAARAKKKGSVVTNG